MANKENRETTPISGSMMEIVSILGPLAAKCQEMEQRLTDVEQKVGDLFAIVTKQQEAYLRNVQDNHRVLTDAKTVILI